MAAGCVSVTVSEQSGVGAVLILCPDWLHSLAQSRCSINVSQIMITLITDIVLMKGRPFLTMKSRK